MKKYFFGYLFVRIAKLLAVLTLLAGAGFVLFRLEQASLSAQSASYQASGPLRQSLNTLNGVLADSQQMVADFCAHNGGAVPPAPAVAFPERLRDNDDFARLATGLDQVDRQRVQLKDTLVSRFESLIAEIQNKLRAHAAAVAPVTPADATATAGVNPGSTSPARAPTPTPAPSNPADTLYVSQMSNYEIRQRTSALDRGKELLKVLESVAEDASNRKTLTDSVAQIDALSHLLPSEAEVPAMADSPVRPANSPAPAPAPRRELNAEKVADQLARLRGEVRQTVLTTWKVDGAYAQARDLASEETDRCRLASLSVKSIWLAAFGQMGLALPAAIFAAFLILVAADFMQTLLDTATNTGIMASATKS